MKRLLLLFLIVYTLECLISAQKHEAGPKSSLPVNTYPKKSNKVLKKNLKLINRRYAKTTSGILKTKKHIENEYTVFPTHLQKKPIDVPSSPYFPIEPQDEPKARVKKVLPDFWAASKRKKRSPDDAAAANPVDKTASIVLEDAKVKDKVVFKKEATPEKKSTASPEATTKKPKSKGEDSRRLIAAHDATIEDYPYVVSIQKDGEHWCSGAIINQRLVMTTANCVWKSGTMSRLKIRAGSRNVESGGQLVRVAEVMKHPGWSIRKSPDNDLALLLTDNYIRFSHSCHAVDLPNRIMMPVFDDAWVCSWGSARRDGVYDKQGLTLQVYHARLIERPKCNNVTTRFGVIVTENFICLEQTGRRSPCTRDTGAPAVSDGVLWGMASWGIRKLCGTERFPAMFSYTGSQSNMDFIINATHYLMGEQRQDPFLDRYVHVPRARVDVANLTTNRSKRSNYQIKINYT